MCRAREKFEHETSMFIYQVQYKFGVHSLLPSQLLIDWYVVSGVCRPIVGRERCWHTVDWETKKNTP